MQGFDDSSAAPLMAFALESGRTVYWIDPADGGIKRYDNDDCFLDSIVNRDAYNGAGIDAEKIAAEQNAQIQSPGSPGLRGAYSPGSLDPLFPRVLPHFVRAEALAARWRKRYVWFGKAIYLSRSRRGRHRDHRQLVRLEPHLGALGSSEMAAVLMLVCISELGDRSATLDRLSFPGRTPARGGSSLCCRPVLRESQRRPLRALDAPSVAIDL